MTVQEVSERLNLKVWAGVGGLQNKISTGFVSDLMSHTINVAPVGSLWFTLHNHKNTVSIVGWKELAGVVVLNGIKPTSEAIDYANKNNIPLLGTEEQAFEIAGKFYLIREDL